MNTSEKLYLIRQLSGLTQQEMAQELGVTFVALNRWINKRAVPHPAMQEKIDKLYFRHSGEKEASDNPPEAKQKILKNKQKKHPDILDEIIKNKDIFDQFVLSLTYNSNRIEGSSLTEGDTATILFDNASLPNKSLTEHLEAKNHQTALEYLFSCLSQNKPIDEEFILKLHSILMNSVRPDAGFYRRHEVRIVGTYVPTANYLSVPEKMKKLIREIAKKNADIITRVANIHARFEQIHPFSDGNGRVGRLLAHAMLLKNNFPPAVIKQKNKKTYYAFLNKAQLKEEFQPLQEFFYDAVLIGYDIVERKIWK